MSHDLKTPLSSIYGYAMMLNSGHDWSKQEVKDFATTMTEKAAYMDELINDLTYTYQLKNEGVQLNKEEIVLQDYLQNYLKQECSHQHVQLESLAVPTVQIDPVRFERVLNNIVGNAIKHNPEGTPIYLQIAEVDNFVTLTVRDEGIGMPAEQLDNLFNRYYRGTNTTTDKTGTGLGMTIAKQLIEAHGGKVRATSANQKGTSVVIYLLKVS